MLVSVGRSQERSSVRAARKNEALMSTGWTQHGQVASETKRIDRLSGITQECAESASSGRRWLERRLGRWPDDNRFGTTDPTTGLLSRGSRVRVAAGAPHNGGDPCTPPGSVAPWGPTAYAAPSPPHMAGTPALRRTHGTPRVSRAAPRQPRTRATDATRASFRRLASSPDADAYCCLKVIVTVMTTGTGTPFNSVGEYSHCRTASSAA